MRPPVRYFGSKMKLAHWILQHLPQSEVYVEPFGGSGAVLFARAPQGIEVYNDLDRALVGLYRCLQSDELFPKLAAMIEATLYSLAAYEKALEELKHIGRPNVVRKAWAKYVTMNMAINSVRPTKSQWSYVRSMQAGGTGGASVSRWNSRLELLGDIHLRLQRVQVECRDAWKVMQTYDSPSTLFYLDPPYVKSTRNADNEYRHELTDGQHQELLHNIQQLEGMVALSGYANGLYDELERNGWMRLDRRTISTMNRYATRLKGHAAIRTESLWLNPAIQRKQTTLQLFSAN